MAVSALEQLVLELINRARLDPAGEAARYGISLNEGLPAGKLTASAKQPLVLNSKLSLAAERHSQHMINVDKFAHDGIGDGTPGSRRSRSAPQPLSTGTDETACCCGTSSASEQPRYFSFNRCASAAGGCPSWAKSWCHP